MAKSVLVLGGTRFVGLHAVTGLVRRGYKVTVMNRGSHPEVLPRDVEQVRCDRKDEVLFEKTLASVLRARHFDGIVDPSAYFPADVAPIVDVVKGDIGSYVFISTGSVYKSKNLFPWYEDLERVTDDSQGSYGYNKMLCENVLMDAHKTYGLAASMIRPGYIYGPHNTVYREAYFFDRIVARRPVLVPGSGAVLSQFGYVDDLANLIVLAMEDPETSGGQAYNFAGKYGRPLDDYVRACAQAVSCVEGAEFIADIVHYLPDQVGVADRDISKLFPYRWKVNTVRDVSKARYELGYDEKVSLEDGLTAAYRWYRGEIQKGRQVFPLPDYSEEDRILSVISR